MFLGLAFCPWEYTFPVQRNTRTSEILVLVLVLVTLSSWLLKHLCNAQITVIPSWVPSLPRQLCIDLRHLCAGWNINLSLIEMLLERVFTLVHFYPNKILACIVSLGSSGSAI